LNFPEFFRQSISQTNVLWKYNIRVGTGLCSGVLSVCCGRLLPGAS